MRLRPEGQALLRAVPDLASRDGAGDSLLAEVTGAQMKREPKGVFEGVIKLPLPSAEREPDPLRMWALVGWYVLACLAAAAFLASWSFT